MPQQLAPCGTLAAYKRHQRRGEVPCYACLDARNDVTLAPYRRAVLAAAVYTGRPRRGTQRAAGAYAATVAGRQRELYEAVQ